MMHIEKNVGESLLGFLFGEKDTVAVRKDMEALGIRRHLWILQKETPRGLKWVKPMANYVLTREERDVFKSRLVEIKASTDYASTIAKHVAQDKLSSMKSHDWHVFLHHILPYCLRGLLEPFTRKAIMRL